MLIPFCGRYVFRHDINTPETREIMERAVGAKAEELDADWPGHVFTLPNNTYAALLGTPHGKGVVHLLTQHASGLHHHLHYARCFPYTGRLHCAGGDRLEHLPPALYLDRMIGNSKKLSNGFGLSLSQTDPEPDR